MRSGGVSQTSLNYTGQRLDATGLLYYHARYYDPSLARFISPDSIVPGASLGAGGALGTVGQEQNSKLTVDFHESAFVSSVQGENQQILQKGFWFQLSGQDKQKAKEPWGPDNPQAINRYSYVLNDPLRFDDPTGHKIPGACGPYANECTYGGGTGSPPRPIPGPVPTVEPTIPVPPQESDWDRFWREVSDTAGFLQFIANVQNATFEDLADLASQRYGTDVRRWDWDHARIVGSKELGNISRTGDERLYVQVYDPASRKWYQLSVDRWQGATDVEDIHFSSGPQGWTGSRRPSR